MTTVTFLTEDARIIGFDVQGHSGWGESGEDIVCAAITSAVRLVEATVNDVMGLCAAVKGGKRMPRSPFGSPADWPTRPSPPVRIS